MYSPAALRQPVTMTQPGGGSGGNRKLQDNMEERVAAAAV